MAFSDWETIPGVQTGGRDFVGGIDGSQQVNSSLSDPLTLQGDDCRRFQLLGGTASEQRDVLYCPDTTLHPNLNAIPDTKAIRVEAWLRQTRRDDMPCIGVKTGRAETQNGFNRYVVGYWLALGYRPFDNLAGVSGNSGLAFSYSRPSDLATTRNVDIPGSWTVNQWHNFRVEVTPVLNGGIVDRDFIEVFHNTGTEASPVWSSIFTDTVVNGDGDWIPWGLATDGRVGFFIHMISSGSDHSAYIDSFRASLKNR